MIPKKTEIVTIEQKIFLRGHQKFEIRQDGDMEVTFKRFSTHNQFKFPLWQLNPNPTRLKHAETGAFVGTYVFGIICIGFIVGMCFVRDWAVVGGLAFPLLMFGAVYCACLWKLKMQSINANVYYFRHNDGQIHVWFSKPDPETFQSFCETLSKKAEEAWTNRAIDPVPQSLAGELAALKKLKDSGVLNDSEFERAKAKLLEQVEQRKIGFA